jgi:hypothetical protein
MKMRHRKRHLIYNPLVRCIRWKAKRFDRVHFLYAWRAKRWPYEWWMKVRDKLRPLTTRGIQR